VLRASDGLRPPRRVVVEACHLGPRDGGGPCLAAQWTAAVCRGRKVGSARDRLSHGGRVSRREVPLFVRNQEVEYATIKRVLDCERAEGRKPVDARRRAPVDIISSGRHVEVKAFGGSARGGILCLEDAQVREAREGPDCWLYVVDDVRDADPAHSGVIRCSRDEAVQLIERGRQHVHVETTLTVADCDAGITRA